MPTNCGTRGAAELATCRKCAPSARSYTAAKLIATVGLGVNEVRHLDVHRTGSTSDNDPVWFRRHTVAVLDRVRLGIAERVAPLGYKLAPSTVWLLLNRAVRSFLRDNGS